MSYAAHEFGIRREERLALLGHEVKDWGSEDAYPCRASCKKHKKHEHTGQTVLLYAHCSCGWESFVGDHIYEAANILEARLRHLQHQINLLSEAVG